MGRLAGWLVSQMIGLFAFLLLFRASAARGAGASQIGPLCLSGRLVGAAIGIRLALEWSSLVGSAAAVAAAMRRRTAAARRPD